MRAVVWTRYGSPDGLQLREMEAPIPKDNEVLVRVCAGTVSTADTEIRGLKQPLLMAIPLRLYLGLLKPSRVTILGTEFAGEVTAIGKDVTRYQPGDQIFGYTGLRMGTYAEYMCLPEVPSALLGVMAEKPANVSFEEAAAVPFGGLEALHALGQAKIKRGNKVLVVGAGGSIGTYAVQLAKHYGAEVTGVDKPGKLGILRSIGADHVIDYTREDFTASSEKYDVILDTFGKTSFSRSLKSLNRGGAYLNANPGLLGGTRMRWNALGSGKRVYPWTSGYTTENLAALKGLVEAGAIRAVIDRRYPLAEVAEAHRYVESGHKQGNVVVTIAQCGST